MFQAGEEPGPAKPIWHRAWNSTAGFFSLFAAKYGARVEDVTVAPYRPKPRPSTLGQYTSDEVAQHNSPGDAWLIIDGQVLDVSNWGQVHPGGKILYTYAGRDATEVFAALHKNQKVAQAVMRSFVIGTLKPSPKDTTPLIQDFRKLREQFTQEGLMNASPLYYTRKCAELLLMVGTSLYLLWSGAAQSSLLGLLASSLLMAMFIFQCGWTSHDFLHNQVFTNRWYNTLIGGIIANVGIGGSVHWWKSKHDTHHAVPNKVDGDNGHAMDPDIDTVPIIAWTTDLSGQVPATDRALIRIQHILVWPLLAVAYINWVIQGKIHLLSVPGVPSKQRRIELAAICFHHLWLNVSIFACLSLPNAIAFWLISHLLSGFGTAFVFIQSHNAMEVYGDDKDFVTSQLVSTRNINPGLFADWIMGGLNYQIEHHLFPTMPRHSYSRIRTRIMEFCARNNLPYESCSVAESTRKVYRQLAAVARSAAL